MTIRILVREALSFDDLILVPLYSDIKSRKKIDTSVILKKSDGTELKFQTPIISSPMSTITEAYMCNAINSCVINKNIAGQIFQIASGKQTSVNKVTKLITKNIEKLGIYNPKIKYTKSRKGDVPKNYSNIDKAQLLLKWSPKMHLNLGISNTINFFLNEKKI